MRIGLLSLFQEAVLSIFVRIRTQPHERGRISSVICCWPNQFTHMHMHIYKCVRVDGNVRYSVALPWPLNCICLFCCLRTCGSMCALLAMSICCLIVISVHPTQRNPPFGKFSCPGIRFSAGRRGEQKSLKGV